MAELTFSEKRPANFLHVGSCTSSDSDERSISGSSLSLKRTVVLIIIFWNSVSFSKKLVVKTWWSVAFSSPGSDNDDIAAVYRSRICVSQCVIMTSGDASRVAQREGARQTKFKTREWAAESEVRGSSEAPELSLCN